MGNLCMTILWIIIVIWFVIPIYFFCEVFLRPLSIPYLIWRKGLRGCRQIIFFILAIIPGFGIFAAIFGFLSLFQLILTLLPYCQNDCSKLTNTQPPDNVMPIMWVPQNKHISYKPVLKIVGECSHGSSL